MVLGVFRKYPNSYMHAALSMINSKNVKSEGHGKDPPSLCSAGTQRQIAVTNNRNHAIR